MYQAEATHILKGLNFIRESLEESKIEQALVCVRELYSFVNQREDL